MSNVFKGIIWERRCDGAWEVFDQYTGEMYTVEKAVDGKYHFRGDMERLTKLGIAQRIVANR